MNPVMSKVGWYVITVILLTVLIAIGITFLSMWIWPAEATDFVRLTGPDKQHIEVSPQEIVSFREPRGGEDHFPKGTRCLINTTDSKIIVVQETCEAVGDLLKAGKP